MYRYLVMISGNTGIYFQNFCYFRKTLYNKVEDGGD